MTLISAVQVLRIAVALEFFGHGVLALSHHPPWIRFVTMWGIDAARAPALMTAVGLLDVSLAGLLLLRLVRPAILWMALWGFFTAALRPLSGEPFLEFVERGANWGAPLALYLLTASPSFTRTGNRDPELPRV